MSNFVAASNGSTGFTTSITLSPPQTVVAGQIMYVAIAGEDSPGAQSISIVSSGWTRVLLYNGSRQLTVWRKVATAADVGASYSWTSSSAFPVRWVFTIWGAALPVTIATGSSLTPAGGTYDYFPALSEGYLQVIAFTLGDTANNSADRLTQRARAPLQFTGGLNVSAWDTAGPIAAGSLLGVDTSSGGAASTGWVLEGLVATPTRGAPTTLPAASGPSIGTLTFDTTTLTFIPLHDMAQRWERAENAELDPTGLIRLTGDGQRVPLTAQVGAVIQGTRSQTWAWYLALETNARLINQLSIVAGGTTLTLPLLRGVAVEAVAWRPNYMHLRLTLYPSAANLS